MITVEQVSVELGRPTPTVGSVEYERVAQWITRAYNRIEERLGDLAALNSVTVDDVVLEAVATHAGSPDGASSYTVSVDDASTTKRFERSHGRLFITDEQWARLTPHRESGAFTIRSVFVSDPVC